jgi:hypothetical protein
MVKIYYRVSGIHITTNPITGIDWHPRPSLTLFLAHYLANKKEYCSGYSFTLGTQTITITKIEEKQKPAINFTCN